MSNIIFTNEELLKLVKNSDINLKELAEFLQDVPVYLVGSRYLGVETEKSDYDFLMHYTPFRLQKLAKILRLEITEHDIYCDFLDEYDHTLRVREFENTRENNLIRTALTLELDKDDTKIHFIFTYYLDELLEVYEYCRINRLFTKETVKSARIDLFNLLTSKKMRELLQKKPQAHGLLCAEDLF